MEAAALHGIVTVAGRAALIVSATKHKQARRAIAIENVIAAIDERPSHQRPSQKAARRGAENVSAARGRTRR